MYRGLPHAHIVCRIEGVPDDQAGKLRWISEHIQARLPEPGTDPKYETLVLNNMLHKCSDAINGCLNKDGICKRGYQTNIVTHENSFNERGYPVYYRPLEADLRVVPHNRELLLDCNGCHVNVEFCGDVYCVMYLYKYLYKGNKKVSMMLNNTGDVDKEDEIKLLQRGRMLCSMQAWFILWGYQR